MKMTPTPGTVQVLLQEDELGYRVRADHSCELSTSGRKRYLVAWLVANALPARTDRRVGVRDVRKERGKRENCDGMRLCGEFCYYVQKSCVDEFRGDESAIVGKAKHIEEQLNGKQHFEKVPNSLLKPLQPVVAKRAIYTSYSGCLVVTKAIIL